jgi:hypothetical protein
VVSFLRKQESRHVPAEAAIQPDSRANGNPGKMEFYQMELEFLDCRFRGEEPADTSIRLACYHQLVYPHPDLSATFGNLRIR